MISMTLISMRHDDLVRLATDAPCASPGGALWLRDLALALIVVASAAAFVVAL